MSHFKTLHHYTDKENKLKITKTFAYTVTFFWTTNQQNRLGIEECCKSLEIVSDFQFKLYIGSLHKLLVPDRSIHQICAASSCNSSSCVPSVSDGYWWFKLKLCVYIIIYCTVDESTTLNIKHIGSNWLYIPH